MTTKKFSWAGNAAAARHLVETWLEEPQHNTNAALIHAITSALDAERERCAQVVERHAIPGHTVQLPTIVAAAKAIRDSK